MKKAIAMLEEVKESILNAYEKKTGMNRTKLSHMMDDESWFNAKKAVELGFADAILFENKSEKTPQEDEDDTKKEEKNLPLSQNSFVYSRKAVEDSFLMKVSAMKPEEMIPINQLEKRLSLIKP